MDWKDAYRRAEAAVMLFGIGKCVDAVRWLGPEVTESLGGMEGYIKFCLSDLTEAPRWRAQVSNHFAHRRYSI